MTQFSEEDRVTYQEKLQGTSDSDVIFKHLKKLKKAVSLPKTLIKGDKHKQSTPTLRNFDISNIEL